MEAVNTRVQGSPGAPPGDRGAPLRARARAVGLTIRIVLDGFTLGKTGGPHERFNNIEALVARLDEVAPNEMLETPPKSRTLRKTKLGRRRRIAAKNRKKTVRVIGPLLK